MCVCVPNSFFFYSLYLFICLFFFLLFFCFFFYFEKTRLRPALGLLHGHADLRDRHCLRRLYQRHLGFHPDRSHRKHCTPLGQGVLHFFFFSFIFFFFWYFLFSSLNSFFFLSPSPAQHNRQPTESRTAHANLHPFHKHRSALRRRRNLRPRGFRRHMDTHSNNYQFQ